MLTRRTSSTRREPDRRVQSHATMSALSARHYPRDRVVVVDLAPLHHSLRRRNGRDDHWEVSVNEAFWVLSTVILGIAAGGFAQAWLFARAEVARLQRGSGESGDAAALRRLESAVETVAVEVERIAEHQRYAARLLAGRDAPPTHGEARVTPGRHVP